MFSVKPSNMKVVPMEKREIRDKNESSANDLADALARAKAAQQSEAHLMAKCAEGEQLLRDFQKEHNTNNAMLFQIKLNMTNIQAKMMSRIEFGDTRAQAMEQLISVLQANLKAEEIRHIETCRERDQLAYGQVPFGKRIVMAALGKYC